MSKTKGRIDFETANKIVSEVNVRALEAELDPDLIFRIITVESNFNPKARSYMNARGLMQVMPRYHASRYRGEDIHAIRTNIRVGVEILLEYKNSDRCQGDTTCALRMYYGDKTSNRYPKLVYSVVLPPTQLAIVSEPVIIEPVIRPAADYLDHDYTGE